MVRIRLRRMGSKRKPFYRVVVADSRRAVKGKFIEEIGYYDPLTEPKTIKIDNEKALEWIEKGAQPTETVEKLFVKAGVYGDVAEVEEIVEEVVETVEEDVETEEVVETVEEDVEAVEEDVETAEEDIEVEEE